MKRVEVVVTTALCIWSLSVLAADKVADTEVPEAVRAAVSKAYPATTTCVFERERRGAVVQYEAEFELKDGERTRRLSVEVSQDGVLLSEEEQVQFEDLPAPVKKAHRASRYGKAPVTGAERMRKGGKTSYEVQVRTAKGAREIVYDEQGAVLDAGNGPAH